jgi:hypothetical protein
LQKGDAHAMLEAKLSCAKEYVKMSKRRFKWILDVLYRKSREVMSDTLTAIHDVSVLVCEPDGEKLKSERDALDLIGEAMSSRAELVLVPVERLEEDFFQLKNGLAGHVIQKFVTYRLRLVILGDISQHVAQSRALRDFVYEANRGNQVWFMTNMQELNERLDLTQ